MAEGNWSVIRVEKISAEGAQKTERHNERKNESYANLNVDTEQIARNVHFKDTGGLTYNEYFQRLIDEGKISTRGQKAGATIFNELVIDVNTRYFEEHGGYEYARQFYEEAYRFGCEIYGEENIVSAVMHADEINKAVSEELGKPVYHYHLHIVAIPTVRKEILWSKRCKDEALRGTVKEVINQVSHSKKWKNTVPLLDGNGQQVISKYGKPMFRKSYSVLQDKLFAHMTEAGFTGFERGVLGSTAENLSSLDAVFVSHNAVRAACAEDVCRISAHDRSIITIQTGRAAASLHVPQDGCSGFHTRCCFNSLRHGSRMTDTFCIDDQMVSFALFPVVDNIVNQLLLVIVVLFRKKDILRAGADAAPQCDITGISAHYFDNTATFM